jgi:hypothetical protein
MANLGWRDAIFKVLQSSSEPMHYTEIAEAIAEQQLRTEFGATPSASVAATLSISFQEEGDESPFVRVSRGYYALRQQGESTQIEPTVLLEEEDEAGLVNAFGMYWARINVLWTSKSRILGQQQPGSTPVDFCEQRGVYLLHDGRAVVYVGRTTDQALGVRLRQHTLDRLNGRWDRFSWFGVYPVIESGSLDASIVGPYNLDMLVLTMEALLIEALEPPQNRKRGDDFKAVEFLQVEDPEIQKTHIMQLMDELKRKLSA